MTAAVIALGVALFVLALVVRSLNREVERLRRILMRLSVVAFTTSDTVQTLVDEWEGS